MENKKFKENEKMDWIEKSENLMGIQGKAKSLILTITAAFICVALISLTTKYIFKTDNIIVINGIVIVILSVVFWGLSQIYFRWARKHLKTMGELYQEHYERNETIMRNIIGTIRSYIIFLDKENKYVLYTNLGNNNIEYIAFDEDGKRILNKGQFHKVIKNAEDLNGFMEALENQEYCNIERKLEFTNGKVSWYRIRLEAVKDHNGIVIGNLIIAKNVTEENKKREELLTATRKQNKAFMALSHEFRTPINAISGSIDLLSLSKNLNSKEMIHIKNMKDAYKGLLGLVTKATDYTNIQSGDLVVEKQEFSINELLESIGILINIRAYEKQIGYCVDIEPDVPGYLIGDKEKISRVLQSLLYNAVEHTENGCIRLSISRKKEGEKEFICYSVTDTGCGIKEEFIDKIFEELIGFEISNDGYVEGLGVSLFVCKRIIELMGGTIACESEYGKGSCFRFELEMETPEDKPIAEVKHPENKSIVFCSNMVWKQEHLKKMSESLHIPVCRNYMETGIRLEEFSHIFLDSHFEGINELLEKEFVSSKKILILETSKDKVEGTKKADAIIYEPFTIMMFAEMLNLGDENTEEMEGQEKLEELVFQVENVKALVVDDNAVNLMVASNVLMQYGIEVEEADSGNMAVKKCYENEYDLIFMDYLMPDMNGVETIRNIRNLKQTKKSVIIALSANVSKEITDEFESVGANHVMSKPLELKELSQVLKIYIPEGKFVKEEAMLEEAEEAEMIPKEDIKSILYSVKGLDVKKGLANVMGATETYVKVLNICCTNITEQIEYLKAAQTLLSSGGLKICFHSLKGILANIGADDLSEFSKKMEIAALEQDEAYIKENEASYIEQVESFRDSLKGAIEEYKKLTASDTLENYVPMDHNVYVEKLGQLINRIKRFEFNEINDLLEELIAASQEEEKKILKEAYDNIQQFQYEEALELVRTIKK